ncbi:MAG: hypothetical protein LBB48_07920 [Treponema sp.]|nr:hypothetical protein [Treponema sp.]
MRVDKPYFVLLFHRIRPKLACPKAGIAALFRFYPVFVDVSAFKTAVTLISSIITMSRMPTPLTGMFLTRESVPSRSPPYFEYF